MDPTTSQLYLLQCSLYLKSVKKFWVCWRGVDEDRRKENPVFFKKKKNITKVKSTSVADSQCEN
jgi:hypothetical protein